MAKLIFDLPITNSIFRKTSKQEMFCSSDLNQIWDLDRDKAYRLTVFDEKPEDFDHEVNLTSTGYHIEDVLKGDICLTVRWKNLDWMNQKVWVTLREEGFNE